MTELLGVNKPDKNDFYGIKEWEREFTPKIKSLKESLCRSDSRFGVILWAVFFLTTTSIEDLRQTFGYLPPYLQIRGVKKLFQLISQGKIKQNAKSLYEIINSGSQRVCLPLEIVFSYLIRREENPQAKLDNNLMLQLLDGREDHPEWIGIRQMISSCDGRWIVGENTGWQGELYNGLIEKRQDGRIKLFVPNHMIDELGEQCNYNNKYSKVIPEQIKISFSSSEYQCERVHDGTSYLFDKSCEMELYSIARRYDCKYDKMDHQITFTKDGNDEVFCECRASEVLDSNYSIPFYWCRNYPCFRPYLRFMLDTEWERYTVLDFMRILKIPIDIIKSDGKVLKYGHFIMLSGYLRGFANFYEHIKCRKCGGLLRPQNITNYASRAVNEYQCENEKCSEFEQVVYLNHCFNRQKCDTIIDSRDSKTCPNGQYICPKCGACCSTENFRRRISNLNSTGGVVSKWIMNFVDNELGHWERQERYCYKCGNKMQKDENNGSYYCSSCNVIEGSQIDNVIPHGSDIPF